MSTVKLSPDAILYMVKDATKTFPNECCGFLFGFEGDETRNITEAVLVNNTHEGDQKRRFAISREDYTAAEKYAEKNGLQILGIYHSHPNHPAVPSITDLNSAVPFLSYVILSVPGEVVDAITSWELDLATNEFVEEKVELLSAETVAA